MTRHIKAVNTQNNALINSLAALEQRDYDMVAASNEMLAEGRAEIRSHKKDLEKLAEAHNAALQG